MLHIYNAILVSHKKEQGFPGGLDGKVSACSAGDPGLIPGLGRSPGEGNGNPLQYSCLENSMDRGAWQATVHGVAQSGTRLSDFTSIQYKRNHMQCTIVKAVNIPSQETSVFPSGKGLLFTQMCYYLEINKGEAELVMAVKWSLMISGMVDVIVQLPPYSTLE